MRIEQGCDWQRKSEAVATDRLIFSIFLVLLFIIFDIMAAIILLFIDFYMLFSAFWKTIPLKTAEYDIGRAV
ncbi:hypothetical protein EDM02_01140 [Candidatus Cardinium hertigii]|jgi:hypothetical protein|uniref:Uncharacterized protein n=1 Tax=Candidatus Cardinium hertigii TaxID=247481 RepID=A0A3N2QCT1_9BACT|nr:hypothetical protein EDM02_01140 [Candidatus Cardinium hertigii]